MREQLRAAGMAEEQRRKSLDRITSALAQAESTGGGAERDFQRVFEERTREHQAARRVCEDLRQKEKALSKLYEDERAFLAQSELLKFIRSRRYAFTPVNLANAMAGLPEMGWRQSAKRCSRHKPKHGDGAVYWLFKLIRRALSERKPSEPFVELVKLKLQSYKPKGGLPCCGGKEELVSPTSSVR